MQDEPNEELTRYGEEKLQRALDRLRGAANAEPEAHAGEAAGAAMPRSAPAPGDSLEQQLEKLASDIAQLQTDLKQMQADVKDKQEKYKALSDLINRRTSILDDYTKQRGDLLRRANEIKEYAERKQLAIDAQAGNDAPRLRNVIDGERNKLKQLKDAADAAQKEFDEAVAKLAECTGTQEAANSKFKEYQQWTRAVDALLKEVEGYRTKIETAEDQDKLRHMYFYFYEKLHKRGDVKVMSVEELRQQLNDAWDALVAASNAKRDAEANRTTTERQLAEARAAHADAEKNIDQRILAALDTAS